jgi:hypothetical protein
MINCSTRTPVACVAWGKSTDTKSILDPFIVELDFLEKNALFFFSILEIFIEMELLHNPSNWEREKEEACDVNPSI